MFHTSSHEEQELCIDQDVVVADFMRRMQKQHLLCTEQRGLCDPD